MYKSREEKLRELEDIMHIEADRNRRSRVAFAPGALVRLRKWTRWPGECGIVMGIDHIITDDSGPDGKMYRVLVDGRAHLFIHDDLEKIT